MTISAYIDETGDRGTAANSSPIFGMAAIVVDDRAEAVARAALTKLRADFGTPAGRPLSWKDDVKRNADRAAHAARTLAALESFNARVIYVCHDKGRSRAGTYSDDQKTFYNYVAYYTLERILRVADTWPGGPQDVHVRFGAVRGFDHTLTAEYFKIKRHYRPPQWPPPWRRMASCTWVQASQFSMSQVADLYAGFMKEGVWPNTFGFTEGAYMKKIWPQISCADGCAKNRGIKGMPDHDLFRRQDWWPCNC